MNSAKPRRPRIIVIGAGTAGIPAALTALELGAEVCLVEKSDRVGGMLWASGAVLSGAGSRLQKSRGIDDTAEAHEREVMTAGRDRADPALLRLATAEAGGTIDWLESIGTRFTPESPVVAGLADHHELYRTPRSYLLEAPPELGPYRGPVLAGVLQRVLEDVSRQDHLQERLMIRLGTRVTALCTSDGRVVGCEVVGAAGPERLTADVVLLCTGGYAADQTFLKRFHGHFAKLLSQGLAHATGDGIRLAEAVGAEVVNEDVVIPMMGAVEDPNRPGFRLSDTMVGFGRPPGIAGDIWINNQGRRFVPEDSASPDERERAILGQPGAVMIALFDEPMRRGLTPEVGSWTKEHLGEPPDPRLVTSAATLPELASQLGIEPEVLSATVRDYNSAVNSGVDPLGRMALPRAIETAPFHAVRTASSIIVTFAGIRVDARLRVVDSLARPIPGLYAAGEVLGGGQIQGDGFSSGMSVTPAIAFGRLAARFGVEDLEASDG